MSARISPNTISNVAFLFILLMLGISTYVVMPDLDNTAEAGTGLSAWVIFALAVLQIPLLLFIFSRRVKTSSHTPAFIFYYYSYFLWMTAITLLRDNVHNIKGLTVIAMTILVFPFLLSTSYYRARNAELNKWFFVGVIFVMLCIIKQYYNIYSIANLFKSAHIGVSYFPLFILPLLLLPSSRVIRYASIAITAIIIISSIKRGGLIALGAGLVVYVLVEQMVSGKSASRKWLAIIAMIIMMGTALHFLKKSETTNIIERIASIKDDGGSDRDVVWADTYANIQNRDVFSRMVGNGYRSAQRVSHYNLPAHNDILEIWYDFGGIGIIMYGIAFFSLCFYVWRVYKRKSRYAPHLALTMTIYFFISMISIVILYFWLALLMVTIGILAGLADRELDEENEQEAQKSIVES